jgi:hypothetical protein
VGLYEELRDVIDEVADRVDRWTGADSWTFEPDSPAAAEVANNEMRADGSPWGDRPVRTAYQLAQMATKYATEMARSVAVQIGASRPAPSMEVLARSALEAASVAWWLLEPGLTARQRVCRMQLLRRNSAKEYARAIAEVGADPSVVGGETVASVEAYGQGLGLGAFGSGGEELEGERRPGYTARVKAFIDALGYHGAYSIYSGTAHAELAGLWRLFPQNVRAPQGLTIFRPGPDPQAARAAADGALKSMIGPVERIALLFGWPSRPWADEYDDTINHINKELGRLRNNAAGRSN